MILEHPAYIEANWKKGAGAVLISFKQEKSDVLLSSFDFQDNTIESETAIRLMLLNMGVQYDNSIHENKRAVDENGNLIKFKDEPEDISFWVFIPRSLEDLLAEPDMPKLSLDIQDAKDFTLGLNGRNSSLKDIPLERGCNKFEIKFRGNIPENKQNIKANLKCDQPIFLKQIASMIER